MAKRKFQVIKATTRDIPGLTVGGKPRYFGKNGTFQVSDEGEAREIDKVLGAKGTGEVAVTSYTEKEHGHTYTFGASKKFSDAWEEFEKRRKRKRSKRTRSKQRVEVKHDGNTEQGDAKGVA